MASQNPTVMPQLTLMDATEPLAQPSPLAALAQESPLADVMERNAGIAFTDPIQRDRDRLLAKIALRVEGHVLFNAGLRQVMAETDQEARELYAETDRLLADVGERADEEELGYLLRRRKVGLAAAVAEEQDAIAHLRQTLRVELEHVLNRQDHEYYQRTRTDQLIDLLDFGHREMELRGMPPLTYKEEVINVLTGGLLARKKIEAWDAAHANSAFIDVQGEVHDATAEVE